MAPSSDGDFHLLNTSKNTFFKYSLVTRSGLVVGSSIKLTLESLGLIKVLETSNVSVQLGNHTLLGVFS